MTASRDKDEFKRTVKEWHGSSTSAPTQSSSAL